MGSLCLIALPSHAEPFVGHGESSAVQHARDEALRKAKIDSLRAAIDGLVVALDAAEVTAVLASHELWTGAYRIVDEGRIEGRSSIQIEVEVDLPRLTKRVAKSKPRPRTRGYRLGKVVLEGCASNVIDAVLAPLRLHEIFVEAPASDPLHFKVRCEALGRASFTSTEVARVAVTIGGALKGSSVGAGLATSAEQAQRIAGERAGADLAQKLTMRLAADVVVRIEEPWPASRIRRIEGALREAVMGVREAELVAIEPSGTLRIDVLGDTLDAATLTRELKLLSFPDFQLDDIRIDSPYEITIRLH